MDVDAQWRFIDKTAEELGVLADARRKWQERGSVPYRWRLPIMEAARKARFRLDPETFDALPARERKGVAA